MHYGFTFDEADFIDVDMIQSEMGLSVSPLIFRRHGEQVHNQGTAFCIATFKSGESLFLSAAHVIAELEDADEVESFVLLPQHEDLHQLSGARVTGISFADASNDIALLIVDRTTAPLPVRNSKSFLVTLDPPVIGEYTMALGYPHTLRADSSAPISYELKASRGTTTRIHPNKRDSSLSNFPTFETTARYDHGMSGGPIINAYGHVLGIISHGFDMGDNSIPLGYGACLGAIAELNISLQNNDGVRQEFSVKELIEAGLFGVPGATVTLERNDHGVTLTWFSTDQ